MNILFELFPHLERRFNPDTEDLIAEFREMLISQRSTTAGQGERNSLQITQLAPPATKPAIAAPVAVVAAAKVASAEEISDNFLNCFLQ